jgi:membrane-associated phospholipid phosphatase
MKGDIRQLYVDVLSIYKNSVGMSRRTLFAVLGFIGIWTIAFLVDSQIRAVIQHHHTEVLDELFSLFHWYGKPFFSIVMIGIFYFGGIITARSRIKEIGFTLFETFAISGIIVTLLKSFFGRWRPYAGHGSVSFQMLTLGPNDHLSLPSGDVAIAFAFSTIIANTIENTLWRWIWYIFAIVTSLGRIYHDQHWMSDVLLAAVIANRIGVFLLHNKHIHAQESPGRTDGQSGVP